MNMFDLIFRVILSHKSLSNYMTGNSTNLF